MKLKSSLFLSLLAVAVVYAQSEPPAPLDDASQKKVIADVTAKALAYSKELPDFVCTQVNRHNVDSTGTRQAWKLVDTTHEQLTFAGGKEEYKTVSINGKKANGESRSDDLMAGSEFGDILATIFDPKAHAELVWSTWASVRGHRVHQIGFRVPKDHSTYTVEKSKKDHVVAGLLGIVYADADTNSVLRVVGTATSLPPHFAIAALTLDMNYDFAKIGDHYYLVPLKADVQYKEGKSLVWDETDFRDYRKP